MQNVKLGVSQFYILHFNFLIFLPSFMPFLSNALPGPACV
jgi:hypothetical protein